MTTPDPFSAPPPGQPAYGQQPAGYGPGGYGPPPQGYGPPGPGGWQQAPQTDTKAMIALGLAIAAYTPTIPFIGAIAAIVLSRISRREILASGGAKTGLGLCSWALWLSVVHLVLLPFLILAFFGVLLLPFLAAS